MSSRGALVAILFVLAGVVLWLLTREGPPAETDDPATAVTSSAEPPAVTPRGTRTVTDEPEGEASVALRGEVVAAGRPVAGAVVVVSASDGDETWTARTSADGRFVVDALVPGRYAASATASGYLPAVERGLSLSLNPSLDATVTLTLEPGGEPLRGTVSDVTGGPIDGALVRATPLAGVAALRRLDAFGSLADDDGEYRLQVRPGRYRVEVSHPDYASQRRTIEVGPGAQRQDFGLVPMGTIEGTVREHDGGAVVPRAWVSWGRERQQMVAPGQRVGLSVGGGMVRADEQGRFRLRGLSPGAISLRARASARASERAVVVPLAMAEHVSDVDLTVVAAYDLRGRVVSQDDPDQGIEGAEVRLGSGERGSPRARADAEGRFVLRGALEGPVTVVASADGWLPSVPGVSAQAAADPDDITISLARAPTIRGRVEPATQAEVSIELRPQTMRMGMGASAAMMLGGSEARAQTDDEGRFELGPAMVGPTTVVARVADGRAGEAVVEVGPDGADAVVIRLQERSTVSGLVRTASGDPVAQASVSLRPRRGPGAADVRLTVNGRDLGVDLGTTTEDGRFELGGVAAGDFEVQVVDRYGEPLALTGGLPIGSEGAGMLTVVEGSDRSGVEIVVDAHDGIIRGTVRTAEGAPAADVWVRATLVPEAEAPRPKADDGPSERREMRMIVASDGDDGGNGRPPVLTDEDGRFELVGLRDASYELVAEGGGGRERVSVLARPGDDVTLELAALGTIEGTATLDGQPLTRFEVRLQGPMSRGMPVRDDGGRFAVDRLDPGVYRLEVVAPDGSGHAEVTVEAGRSVTRNVVLERRLTVRGRIVDRAGEPVVGAMILIGAGEAGEVSIEHSGAVEPNVTDAQGRFEVGCASGPRALLALSPTSPQPMVVHFFVAQPGQDVDLGDLQERELEGRVERKAVQEQDVEVLE